VLPQITGLPLRNIRYTLPDMLIRLRTNPAPDVASAFRDHVRRLGRPERQRTEAARVRIILTRAWRVGLRERLAHTAHGRTRA
jgi:hypothetical protein